MHRDLKPGNIWLTADGVAKIGDFGLAVVIGRPRLTQQGMMVGTVSYMPPEQAMGGGGEPDKRSDLYSFGAMFFEMYAGRPPYIGDDSIAIIGQHVNTPPVSPSWYRPDLPPALDRLILWLLEKDPNNRPESATAVLRALESIDLSPPVGAIHELALQQPDGSAALKGGPNVLTDSPIYRSTFVGREPELRQLQTAFDNALSGQGALVMVAGEPGIGKTALCEQLATYANVRGGRALMGHCYEEGSLSVPYLGFVEAMRSYVLDHPYDELREELGAGAADVARIVSEIRDRVAVELRPAGDPDDDRWRLLQAVTTFLRNASVVQPLLIVLEDLQWADRGTLDLLTHIARNLSGARLLIVGTYRDVEVDRSHPLSSALAELRRASNFARVPLRGLTVDEVYRMMNSLTNQDMGWAFAEAVHRQTEGNPLFIQEMMRDMVEEGTLTRQEGRWLGSGGLPPEMSIPEGLRDVIGKRLSRLSPECNRLLSVAAVIGRDFGLDTLQAVAGVSEEEVLTGLEEALKVGVIEDRSQGSLVRYRFTHAFFRQTMYEELITPRRIRLHQQVAKTMEAQYASRREEHAVELAEHFAFYSDPEGLAKAVQYSELAAARAMSLYAYSEAVRLLEKALQVQEVLDPEDKSNRCDLLLALGEALMPAGEPQRAADQIAGEVFILAETINDGERAFGTCRIALEGLARYGGAAIEATQGYRLWAERADRYAKPGTADRVRADLALSRARVGAGDSVGARAFSVRAAELARQLGVPETLFDAAIRIIQLAAPQHQEERLRLAEEFTTRPRDGVSARTLGLLFFYSARAFLGWGRRTEAEDLLRQLEELGERTRDALVLEYPLLAETYLHTIDGRLEAAVDSGARLMTRSEELGSPLRGRQNAAVATLRPLLYLGRGEEALANLPVIFQMAGTQERPFMTANRALCLAHLGHLAEAQSALGQCLTALGIDSEEGEDSISILIQLLETAAVIQDKSAASVLSHRLSSVAFLATADIHMTCVARHLGAAAALLGDREKAKAYYEQALEVCANIRFRPEIALTRLQLAELLLEEADGEAAALKGGPVTSDIRKDAIEHLDFAIGEFQAMKMQTSLERALRHKGLLKA
ncbi:MAG: hypothetical protein EXR50_06375 [Dehalococcoidia bacterium]|nr:hypothetical protein [Dehalococcoidia bacterium]